ncbi:UNVERIFIED_CONTAM: hypothetical protein K2H54_040196 [Gekko kuhli]
MRESFELLAHIFSQPYFSKNEAQMFTWLYRLAAAMTQQSGYFQEKLLAHMVQSPGTTQGLAAAVESPGATAAVVKPNICSRAQELQRAQQWWYRNPEAVPSGCIEVWELLQLCQSLGVMLSLAEAALKPRATEAALGLVTVECRSCGCPSKKVEGKTGSSPP